MHVGPVCRQGQCLTTGVKMHLDTSKTLTTPWSAERPTEYPWTLWLKSHGRLETPTRLQLAQAAFAFLISPLTLRLLELDLIRGGVPQKLCELNRPGLEEAEKDRWVNRRSSPKLPTRCGNLDCNHLPLLTGRAEWPKIVVGIAHAPHIPNSPWGPCRTMEPQVVKGAPGLPTPQRVAITTTNPS